MLNVTDKVYQVWSRYGETNYKIYTVSKVTEKLAILSNGTRLKKQPKQFAKDEPYYIEYGNAHNRFYALNDEVKEKLIKIEKENMLSTWYANFSPTIEQMTQIYNLINQEP